MAPNPLRYDPTRTATLQRQFMTVLKQKFARVRKHVLDLLLEEDAFGLKTKKTFTFNVFCPTGKGGGVDPTCSLGGHRRLTDIVAEEVKKAIWAVGNRYEAGAYIDIQTGAVLVKRVSSSTTEVDLGVPPDTPVIQIHTHPDEGAFSDMDWGMLGWSSIQGMIVIDPQFEYRLDKVDPAKRNYSPRELRDAWNEFLIPIEAEGNYDNIPLMLHRVNLLMTAKFPNLKYDRRPRIAIPTANTRWQFKSTPEQLEAFQEWLARELQDEILNDPTIPIDDWWEQYVERGYRQGAGRAFDDTKPAALGTIPGTIPRESVSDFYQGTREEFLRSSFAHPETVEKLKLLSSRVLSELKGVTDAMAQSMGRALVDGLSQGDNPRIIARRLAKDVDGIGLRRALTIARTEIIRAHAEGQLDAFGRLGVEELGVMVEWSTSHDNRVCKLCAPLENTVIRLSEAKGTLPRHPNCRCAWIPANVGEDKTKQNRTKQQIEKAFDKSIAAEIPEGSTRTLDEQREKTKWIGADAVVVAKRPVSILD